MPKSEKPCCRGVTGAGHPCSRAAAGSNGYCVTHARSARRNATLRASSAARAANQAHLFAAAAAAPPPSANAATLGITKANYTWSNIKSAYKKRVLETHPDKGGTAANFNKVRNAYKALRRTLKKSSSSSSE